MALLDAHRATYGHLGVSCGDDISGFGLALLEPIGVVLGRLNGVLNIVIYVYILAGVLPSVPQGK